MAERTYRRITEDIEEVRYIAGLVDANVTIEAPKLSGTGDGNDLTQLRKLLEYRDKWNGILADLTAESQPSAKTSTSTPRGTRATGKPRTGGDADKSE